MDRRFPTAPASREAVAGRGSAFTGMRAGDDAFVLHAAEGTLLARGRLGALPTGSTATLATRVRDFFDGHRDGPGLLVGALPFDHARPDALHQPATVSRRDAADGWPSPSRYAAPTATPHLQVTADPPPDDYAAAVARCVSLLRAERDTEGGLRKVVLARSLRATADPPVDPWQLAARLAADTSVTTYLVPLPACDGIPRTLVGATPELLVSRRGRRVRSRPLAGSLPRDRDPQRDRAAAAALLASAKDLDEHRVVVEAIMDALAPLCTRLHAPARPALRSTASMWHLETRIEGELRDGTMCAASLAARLHPTPAICGQPRDRAAALITQLEPFDRGFFAGAVGWTDAAGDGDWHVAIRCAELRGADLRLYAGAGIVDGSDPAQETLETAAKFGALLDALGLGDNARLRMEIPS